MYRLLARTIPLLVISTSSVRSLANLHPAKLALSQQGSIVLSDTSIRGLKIGMSEREVIKKLGAPKSRKVQPNGCTGTNDIILKYSNLDLYILEGARRADKSYLTAITTTNSRYGTNKGIRVGDSIDKAGKIYKKAPASSEKGRYLSLTAPRNNECTLTFSSKNGKAVSEIVLVCAIC
jgi:hypothetical protein